MNYLKKWIILSFFVIVSLTMVLGETKSDNRKNIFSWDINRWHFGLGATISTGNFMGLVENAKLYQAMENGQPYNYPGYTQEENEAVAKLNKGMIRSIIAGNIFASMNYGIKARLMFSALIADLDVIYLPNDGSFNGRSDFQVVPSAGIRLPWFVMPYFMVGPAFTFSFYPDYVSNIESWKLNSGYGVYRNFAFRAGLSLKTGVDLNFKYLSFGLFYQYEIKDFSEFTDFYYSLFTNGYSNQESSLAVFAYQSRLGAAITFYLF